MNVDLELQQLLIKHISCGMKVYHLTANYRNKQCDVVQ